MFRIFSTLKTSVSPTATMNSHDAYVRPSIRIVTTAFIARPATPLRAALGSREAGADPLLRLHVRRRVHALGRKALDVVEHHHLLGGVVARLADRRVLDRLVAVAE